MEGNGQSELIEAITGMRHINRGSVTINGQDVTGMKPRQIRALGVSHVPEDRVATGTSGQASVTENLLVGKEKNKEFSIAGIHQKRRAMKRYAQSLFDRFDIRGAGVDTAVGSLSGGNMQKVVVAR